MKRGKRGFHGLNSGERGIIGTGSNSAEEDDLLYRSRKKVRVGEAKMLNDNTVIPRKEDWMSEKDKFSSDDSPKVVPKVLKPRPSRPVGPTNP